MNRVLVTDGEQRSALAVARCLGAAGYEVHVAAHAPPSLAGSSRYVAHEHRVPSPLEAPEAFSGEVGRVARDTGASVLLPVTDASALAALEHQHLLDDSRLPLPPLESFRIASDKARVAELARAVGLRSPRQWVLRAPEDARDPELAELRFPVVAKGATSVTGGARMRWVSRVAYAESPTELRSLVAGKPTAAFPLVIQERIRGPGIGVFALLWNGRLLAHFGHRRIREKPPSGGVSVLRESVPVERTLLESATELLQRLGWRGVAMLECKVDEVTGHPYVLEVNGRFWGSLQLAVDAGVPFPRLLVEAALGRPPAPENGYRLGVRSRWLWGDTDHLLIELRHAGAVPASPAHGAWPRLRAVAGYLGAFRPGVKCEVMRFRDPGPFLRETADRLRVMRRRDGGSPVERAREPPVRCGPS